MRNVDFCRGRKTGEPRENPSKQGKESTINENMNNELIMFMKFFSLSLPSIHYQFGSRIGHSKKSLIGHKSEIVGKSETAINQLDYAAEKLLISTMTKTAVLDLAT
jgi:hypothetical protein